MNLIPIIAYALVVAVAIAAAVMDLRTGLVYNKLTYTTIILALIFWAIAAHFGSPIGLPQAIIGLLAALIPYALMFALGGLGGGDVKLMAALGALSASWEFVLATSIYAMIVSLIMAFIVMAKKKIIKQTFNRIFTALLFAQAGCAPAKMQPLARLPFALAVAVAATIAGLEYIIGWQSPWSWLGP
ncbi:prepilin peptidase [Poriferisphaera sp. WC338]|uniref:prepilin peptidase n=1 Tax=Poriferisphaera sp. WC338 TaxID=3425129 RepID=UPI003D81A0A5